MFRVRIHGEEAQAKVIQDYETMVLVLSMAFGGSNKSEAVEPVTVEDARRQLQAIFGKGV